MKKSDWNELISDSVTEYLKAFRDADEFREGHKELTDTAELVGRKFKTGAIEQLELDEMLAVLRRFDNVRAAGGRLMKIFSRNDIYQLRKLIGDVLNSRQSIDARLEAAYGRQLGEGFFSELLCYFRPYQWPVKSLSVLRGIHRVTEIFDPAYLREFSYDQFRKFLLPVVQDFRSLYEFGFGETRFFDDYRFLVIYRWLASEGAGKARRTRKAD